MELKKTSYRELFSSIYLYYVVDYILFDIKLYIYIRIVVKYLK